MKKIPISFYILPLGILLILLMLRVHFKESYQDNFEPTEQLRGLASEKPEP